MPYIVSSIPTQLPVVDRHYPQVFVPRLHRTGGAIQEPRSLELTSLSQEDLYVVKTIALLTKIPSQ
jgi:hypothetical protein